jgi:lipoate-protein ligase A
MALDEALLESMPRLRKPALRFYGWTAQAASFGYFQKYGEVERLTHLRPLIRRPTAGGLVPHDADWTYSVQFPATHSWYALSAMESYHRVHEWIQKAFATLGVETELAAASKSGAGQCFFGYEKSDLLWRGKKISGAAQRRTRDGLLIQGSVQPPRLSIGREKWEKAMTETALSKEPVRWVNYGLDEVLKHRVLELIRQKYGEPTYNQKR